MSITRTSDYDPRAHGAKCDECPLRNCRPVPPESRPLAQVCVVGDAPNDGDEKQGKPFVGPAGSELEKALRMANLSRGRVHLTNAILCKPPENDLKKLLQEQKKTMKLTGTVEKTPQECCAPRLEREIEDFQNFIALGKTAATAITGTSASILSIRGAIMDLEATIKSTARKVMPTISPMFVMHQQRWAHVFRSDIAKAARWFRGESGWQSPNTVFHPTADALRDFLSDPEKIYTYDIETDGIESLDANIRCIAIGDAFTVYVVGFRSNARPKEIPTLFLDFYEPEDGEAVAVVLREFFENPNIYKCSHNGGYYDRAVIRHRLGCDVRPNIDTIILHKSVESELPHGLAYVASLYTDAPAWKCYDDQTEVLTEEGWVLFPELKEGVCVTQWHEGNVSFVVPHAYVNQPYSGKMWHLQDQATDLLVSPDHKMVYRPVNGKALKSCAVQDLPTKGSLPHGGSEDAGCRDWSSLETLSRTQVDYEGRIYCVSVPSGFILVRRSGKITVSGNTDREGNKLALGGESDFELHDYCLFDNTVIHTEDGEMLLSDIVRTKWSGRVWSQAASGVKELKKVIGWHYNVDESTRWLEVRLRGQLERHHGLICTPDHQLIGPDGPVEAQNLRAGDKVFVFAGNPETANESHSGVGVIESVTPWEPTFTHDQYRLHRRFCIDVEDNHNFFTTKGLVHNCAKDVAITARVVEPLIEQVAIRKQAEVYNMDMQIQEICLAMHTAGMYVDQAERHKREVEMLKRRHTLLEQIRSACGRSDFNPGSVYHMRDLLFSRWQLSTESIEEDDRYTGSGDLSTGDLILRCLLTDPSIPDHQRDVIKLIRRYRKVLKVLGTYVVKLRPSNMAADVGWDEDEEWADADARKRYGEIKKGIVNPLTGRMHPGYNAHVAVTGRLSSSKPINCFDRETELLTEVGWVRFDALNEGVKVAQWHEDGAIDFVVPTAYHQGRHVGTMVVFKSQSADLTMTPNHRLPLVKVQTGRLKTFSAAELVDLRSGWLTLHAGEGVDGPGLSLSPAKIQLMVAIQAKGTLSTRDDGVRIVDLDFTRRGKIAIKQRKIDRLSQILDACELKWSWQVSTGLSGPHKKQRSRVVLNERENPALTPILDLLGSEKVWGPWLLDMTKAQRQVFVDEVFHWDGHAEGQNQYASVVKRNADWVQTLLCLTGVRANIRRYQNNVGGAAWIVDVRRTRVNAITHRAERSIIPWDEEVFCVTVPSDAILVRRNGKITITRQSQNFPKAMRSLVIAQPGNVLVGADMDQLELRIAAARWGVELYLRAFAEGKDPHSMTAFAIFGNEFCKAAGIDPNCFDMPGKLVGTAYSNGKFEGSGDAMSMRNLSKAVQYASCAADEEVAVLDARRVVRIADVKPGDLVWAWSNERHRYEPTRVKNVWRHGTKECVDVTFKWNAPKCGGTQRGTVRVTPDHPMLLRDGRLRHAGSLSVGDRLMPFYRDSGDTYAMLRPFNTPVRVEEHLVVERFYAAEQEGTQTLDLRGVNRKANNIAPAPGQKGFLRWLLRENVIWNRLLHDKTDQEMVDLINAQFGSSFTRQAVRGTRNLLAVPAPTGKPTRALRRASKLDAFEEKIGYTSDEVIAKQAGCLPKTVERYRKVRGIPAYWEEALEGTNHQVVSIVPAGTHEVWDLEVEHEDHNFALAGGIFVHNSQYMAKVETVHKLIQKTELPTIDPETRKPMADGSTDLPYAKLPLKKVGTMRDNWLKGAPQFPGGWDKEIKAYRMHGYIQEEVTGRRRDFLDGEAPNEIVNFPIQGSAAGLMNKALVALFKEIPLHKWGPGTGIINQCHDSIVVECPESEAKKVAGLLEEHMNQTHPALPGVRFTAKSTIGKTWKEVG